MIGQYTIQIVVELLEYPQVTKTASFVVTINPCQVSSFTASVQPTATSYFIGDAAMTTFALTFQQEINCGYPETIEIVDMPTFVTYDEAQRHFTVFTDDIAHEGVYTITATSSIEVPKDISGTVTEVMQSELQFSLEVVAGCEDTAFVDWTLTSVGTITMNVRDDAQVIALGPVEDTLSRQSGNQDGLTHCGQRAFRFIDALAVPSFVTLDAETLTIAPVEQTDVGRVTIEIEVSLRDLPEVYERATLTIVVNPCQVASIAGSLSNTLLAYSLYTPAATGAAYTFTQSNDCGYTPTIEVTGLPAFAVHNTEAQDFTVESSDPLDEGSYTVVVTATVTMAATYEATVTNEATASLEFTIEVKDACKLTSLDALVLEDMPLSVRGPATTQSFPEVLDSVSKNLGEQDGFSFCKARVYKVLDLEQHASYLTCADRTITV